MIHFVIRYLFTFMVGASAGWVIELFYRRYSSDAKKWVNPGFLSGPYLPIYGTGVMALYAISDLSMALWIKVLLFAFITTSLEYVTGIFFLRFYNTRLWNYSRVWGNLNGYIAPRFTLYWTTLSLVYYFVLYPQLRAPIDFIYGNLEYSLLVGIFYGVFILDVIQSFNILNRLLEMRDALGQSHLAIQYDQLKVDIAERFDELSERVDVIGDKLEAIGGRHMLRLRRPTFLRPFRGDYSLRLHLQAHLERFRTREK